MGLKKWIRRFWKKVILPLGVLPSLTPEGVWSLQHIRNGEVIGCQPVIFNGITDEGKTSNLDVYFRNQTQLASWYFGLVDNSGFTAFDDADVMTSHSGWSEFVTYSEATRVQWSPDAAASNSISNATPATINITATATLKGGFIVSNSTKSGTSGTLWATVAFTSNVDVVNGDQLKLTYTVNM